MQTSIVEYFAGNEASRCGYCKGKNCSYSNGMWAHTMTVEDYQDLIDRGWRRSGRYCYKPTMDRTCCPQYTIRTDAVNFKLKKSHKKVMKRFRHYIINGNEEKLKVTPSPSMFDKYDDDDDDDDEPESGHGHDADQQVVDQQSQVVEKKLKMNNTAASTSEASVDASELKPSTSPSGRTSASPSSSSTEAASHSSPQKRREPVKPGLGADPSKPKCRKAKEIRREKALQKLGVTSSEKNNQPLTTKNAGKTLENYLTEPFPENCRHHFETRLVMAQKSNKDFMDSFEESLQVYRKYQITIHKDAPSKCSPDQFQRFLCNSSLIYQNEAFIDSNGITVAPGYGAYHQHYLIDGKIIAVGVVDILPRSVSSVYLYYDPDYAFLSFGTLASLFELTFVRKLAKIRPSVRYYYMGFYIHSCPKMRYKAQYSPSDLVCPVTFNWVPVDQCLPIIDRSKFSRLCPVENGSTNDPQCDVGSVGVLYRKQAMQYSIYRAIKEDDDDDEPESDVDEVNEYKKLVGAVVSKRMLLFRR